MANLVLLAIFEVKCSASTLVVVVVPSLTKIEDMIRHVIRLIILTDGHRF